MQTGGQGVQLLEGVLELLGGPLQVVTARGRCDRAQFRADPRKPALWAVVESFLKAPSLLVGRHNEPPSGGCDFRDPRSYLRVKSLVRGAQSGRRLQGLGERGVAQDCGIMNQDGVWAPVLFDVPHGPVTDAVRDCDQCARGVDVFAGSLTPISNLEGRVAECPSQGVADGPRSCLTNLHDQISHGRSQSLQGIHANNDCYSCAEHRFVQPQCRHHCRTARHRETGDRARDERDRQRGTRLECHRPMVTPEARGS